MTPDLIPLSKPTFGDEEVEAVRAVLESGWVAGQGPRGRELEEAFAKLCGVTSAVAVSNCTAALHLAMLSFGIGRGDEVLVADYTYPATGHSVLYTGATPVFVDVRPDVWTMDPDAAAAAITDRTVGIIAVDVFGQCADYEPLRELAVGRGLFLVEDAAPSVGATYRGRPAGSFGDIACISLHARKGVTSGEGGLVTTDDEERAERVRMLSCFGVESAFVRQGSDELPIPAFTDLGYNYKLSDIQCAVALVQLTRLESFLSARRRIARRYSELLTDVEGIGLPTELDDREHTWQSYVLTLDTGLSRSAFVRELRAGGVQANIGTFASHVQPVYGERPPCAVSASCFDRHVAIPMHAGMSDGDVDRVARAVCSAVSEIQR